MGMTYNHIPRYIQCIMTICYSTVDSQWKPTHRRCGHARQCVRPQAVFSILIPQLLTYSLLGNIGLYL